MQVPDEKCIEDGGDRGRRQASHAHGLLQVEQHEGEPGEADEEVAALEDVQQPAAAEHETAGRDECAGLTEVLPPGVGVHADAGDQDVQHDHPAQQRAEGRFRHGVTQHERQHLRRRDEREPIAGKRMRAPLRQLPRRPIRVHLKLHRGEFEREEVGVIGIEEIARMEHERHEENQAEHDNDNERSKTADGSPRRRRMRGLARMEAADLMIANPRRQGGRRITPNSAPRRFKRGGEPDGFQLPVHEVFVRSIPNMLV